MEQDIDKELGLKLWDSREVRRLLNLGANPNAQNGLPLINSVDTFNIETVKVLLEYGADPNAQNGLPLLKAVTNQNINIAKILIAAGADPNMNIETTLGRAIIRNNTEMVKLIINPNINYDLFDFNILSVAIGNKNADIVKLLLDNGCPAPIDSLYRLGESTSEIAKLFYDRGVSPDDLLMCSVRQEDTNIEVIQYLLDKNANVNTDDGFALSAATHYENMELVKLLLEYGADPSIEGCDALKNAAEYENIDMVAILLDHFPNNRNVVHDYTDGDYKIKYTVYHRPGIDLLLKEFLLESSKLFMGTASKILSVVEQLVLEGYWSEGCYEYELLVKNHYAYINTQITIVTNIQDIMDEADDQSGLDVYQHLVLPYMGHK